MCLKSYTSTMANRALDISNKDLIPIPPSFVGKHVFCHDVKCLLLPSSLLIQKYLGNILCISYDVYLVGAITERRYNGMLCRTFLIRIDLPLYDKIFPFQCSNLSLIFL